ncbi:MAG: M56 family metallopeptidase [Saccharospirillaceae bacterium]|nr:M56 family metallopeptidase [Saccharospirillaceae bacterium]MCD8530084.1 M56 family metallopeptidase [Saccharospirillaceae bacterium]
MALTMIHELADMALAGALSLGASSWLASLLWPLQFRAVRMVTPQQRTRLLMLYALLPWVVTFWVVLLLMNPELAGALHNAHCHGDVCGPHVPDVSSASLSAALLAGAVSTVLLFALLFLNRQLRRGHERLNTMDLLSTAATTADFRLIHSHLPLAWCAGLWRPKVYISSALQQQLSERGLSLVLQHEHCHVIRRDNLRKLVLHWLTLLWLPAPRKMLRRQYDLASEQLCDAYTASQGYTADEIAAVMQRLHAEADAARPAAHSTTELRTDELQRPVNQSSADGWLFLMTLLCAQVALFSHWLHPLLDTLFL